jgi:hypothetical protein
VKNRFSVIVAILLTIGILLSHMLVEYSSAHPFPGTQHPLVATQVYLRKVTVKGDWDDGGNGETELIITTNTWIEGHDDWTWVQRLQFDNDADGNDTMEELLINQLIYFHAQCSPPTDLHLYIHLIEDEGGTDVSGILKKAATLSGKLLEAGNKWTAVGIDVLDFLKKVLSSGSFLNNNDNMGKCEDAWQLAPNVGPFEVTYNTTNFSATFEITRYVYPHECADCWKCYKDFMVYFSNSLKMDYEIQEKIMKEDLENKSSHLPAHESFRGDIFSEGLNVVELADAIDVSHTEGWNSSELADWKADFKNTITCLLNMSTYSVLSVAQQFAPYTSKPEYSSEMELAEQELLAAWEALSYGNVSEAYDRFSLSWIHSWNAMLVADEIPPDVLIESDKTLAQTGERIVFGSYGSHDIAGPCTYQWLSSYTWDFGDGSFGYGAVTQHTYGRAGTFLVTLSATDRSSNVRICSLTIAVKGTGIGGGTLVPVDKVGLLSRHVSLAAAVLVAVVAATIGVKRIKREKRKQ